MPTCDYLITILLAPGDDVPEKDREAVGNTLICMSTYCKSSGDAMTEAITFMEQIDPDNKRRAKINVQPGTEPWVIRYRAHRIE